jgi:hypothetical protein
MTRLKYKTEGGFRRSADFYSHDWHSPAALMEALSAAPAREIRIALDKIAPEKQEGTVGRAQEECGPVFEEKAFDDLMLHAAGGHTPALRAGNSGGAFARLLAFAAIVTTVSGYTREAPHTPRTPVPGFPRFSQAALYAQSVAPQAGWFSRT